MNDDIAVRREILALKTLLLALAVFSVFCSFNPQWHFWGVDYLITFPAWLRIILVVVLCASMVPTIERVGQLQWIETWLVSCLSQELKN